MHERFFALTPNQQRIVKLIAAGFKNKEIAKEIGSTEAVIKNYVEVIYDKIGLSKRLEVALWYVAREHEPYVPPAVENWSRPLMVPLRGARQFIDKDLIYKQLDLIPSKNREIFLLYYQHGRTIGYIGFQFGIPTARAQQITTAVLAKIHKKVLG